MNCTIDCAKLYHCIKEKCCKICKEVRSIGKRHKENKNILEHGKERCSFVKLNTGNICVISPIEFMFVENMLHTCILNKIQATNSYTQ